MTDPDPRSEREKMVAGDLYRPGDPALRAAHGRARQAMQAYQATQAGDYAGRRAILEDLLGAVGADVVVRPPFYCDYGFNIRLGDGVFLNYGCVLLDVAPIVVGAGTQIGPAVQIYAADHPRDPEPRRQGLELGRPVTVGANCWIGGGAILLPGVTIGDDATIGAGAVVTRDVPAGATAVGNPARIVRHAP